MTDIVGQALVERLVEWGVDTVFGLPGDGINGVMEGLRRNAEKVTFVLVHHEEAAAFAATAYAKATGRIGVCLATSGPGGIHLANGLYDAKLDHVPVLAITGSQESSVLGTQYQQEVPLDRLFMDVSEYDLMITNPAQVPSVVDNAIRTAYARRGVAHLTIPNDIQVAEAGKDPYREVGPSRAPATAPVYLPPRIRPRDEDLRTAADVLNDGQKVAILAGVGARGAGSLVEETAERLGAPVVKSLLGKMVLSDDSPYTTGGLGLLGTKPSEELMEDIDTLLMLGTNFPYTKFLPEPGKVRVVQVDVDPAQVGTRIPTEVPLVGDVAATLEALLPLLDRHKDKHLRSYQKKMSHWREQMARLEAGDRSPIAPQYLVSLLDKAADEDAILCCDSGTITTWAARHWTIRGSREFYLSGTLATMASGLPYAIGIQHAHPGRQVIAYVGDGGFAMLMAEVSTAARYRLPVKVVINNNDSLGQILWEQMILGYPEHGVRFGEPTPDYGAWAAAAGAWGRTVTDPSTLRDAVSEMLAHPGPAVLDVAVNPSEPPMPGKVSYDQAQHFTQAWLRGQPSKRSIATTLFRDKIEQLKG